MSSATTKGEAYFLGKRAVDDRDSVALDELIAAVRASHRPEVRGIAALYLGAVEWDDRPVAALSRLLADPAKVSLQKCVGYFFVVWTTMFPAPSS